MIAATKRSNGVARCWAAVLVLVLPVATARADMLVANGGGNNVLLFDESIGAFLGEFVEAESGGVSRPSSPVFGPDGNLYVESGNRDIFRFDGSTGAFLDVFALTFQEHINDLAFGPDGNLYVGDGVGGIYRYNGETGEYMDVFIPHLSGGLGNVASLEFRGDGYLYVTGLGSRVFRFDAITGDPVDVFASGGGLRRAGDLEFGLDGNLYVVSVLTGQILRYDGVTGAFMDEFVGGLDWPGRLRLGPDGNFYLGHTGAVQRYDGITGAHIDDFVPAGTGGLTAASGLLFIPEPATLSLLALGTLCIFARKRRRSVT